MHNVSAPKSEKFFLPRMSQAEAVVSVRKGPVKAGQTFRDKRNAYQRKPKHFSGW